MATNKGSSETGQPHPVLKSMSIPSCEYVLRIYYEQDIVGLHCGRNKDHSSMALVFFMPRKAEVGGQKLQVVSEASCPEAPWVYQMASGSPVWVWAIFPHSLPTRNGAISYSLHLCGLSLQWTNRTGQSSCVSVSEPFSLDPKSSGTGDFHESPFPLVERSRLQVRVSSFKSSGLGL